MLIIKVKIARTRTKVNISLHDKFRRATQIETKEARKTYDYNNKTVRT